MDSLNFHGKSRCAGILLHPTSLPSPFGIGDFGPDAKKFIEFLARAKQTIWQILPLGPTGYADSPYQSISAFAGNPLLISPEELISMQLIESNFLNTIKVPVLKEKVDYDLTRSIKEPILLHAFENFKKLSNNHPNLLSYNRFCIKQAYWLENFAIFYSLRVEHKYQSWTTWPLEYRERNPKALSEWKKIHSKDIEYAKFLQWVFSEQWSNLRDYAHQKGISILGDMPIFVAHDSVDVWAEPEIFTLYPDGSLEFMAGVPPDYFSKTGQLWGNPLYKWDLLQGNDFAWFKQRFARMFELYDWIRVDHFRGFEAYWCIPGKEKTAIHGKWIKAPGQKMFESVLKELGNLPIIAEDLGIITPEVEALRDHFNFPGMRVLQFAFGGDALNPHLPHNYLHNSLAYTGTHDNDTTKGWWDNFLSAKDKTHFRSYLNSEGKDPVYDAIVAIYRSVAKWAIIPLQDVLEQGSEARMNTPSVPSGNWQYRMPFNVLSKEYSHRLAELVDLFGRYPSLNK
jgi:4-alpha-glucanotransferase